MFELHSCRILVLHTFLSTPSVTRILYQNIRVLHLTPDASLIWVRGIRDKYYSLCHVDLRESIIHQQHRIVHIIMIYVFYTLLKYTDTDYRKLYYKTLL